jgi:hypothetical protein
VYGHQSKTIVTPTFGNEFFVMDARREVLCT